MSVLSNSSAFQSYIFGCHDGTELELILPMTQGSTLLLELNEHTHLHLGRFEILDATGWRDIEQNDIENFELSSVSCGGSLAAMLSSRNGFFETRSQKNPWCRLTLAPNQSISGIRINNRPNTLWERACSLQIKIAKYDEERLLFDATDPVSVASYINTRVLRALALAPEQCFIEPLRPLLRSGLNIIRSLVSDEGFKDISLIQFCESFANEAVKWLYSITIVDQSNVTLARTAIMLCGLRRQLSDYTEDHILREFLLRLRIFTPQVAFRSIRSSQLSLINNRLYELISDALASQQTRVAIGAWKISGHGIFADSPENEFVPARDTGPALVRLEILQNQFKQAGYTPLLCYGALLGVLRDGMLLEHDDDVDLLMLLSGPNEIGAAVATVQSILRNQASSIKSQRTNTDGIEFLSISGINGIPGGLDIFFGWPDHDSEDKFYLPMEKVKYRSIPFSIIGSGTEMVISGSNILIPDEPENFFVERYGHGWRTPDLLYRLREG